MNKNQAINFLRSHQPMPAAPEITQAQADTYDEVRIYFIKNPDSRSIKLFLRSFGDGDDLGMYQLVGDVFYQLHDGFIFYVDFSMGPYRVQDFVNIHDLCDDACPTGQELTAFFSSGAGDYMAVDKNSSPPVHYIWWHEKQDCPDVDIDTWSTMDAWMVISLENSDSNESILE